jgi:hypothetical protein
VPVSGGYGELQAQHSGDDVAVSGNPTAQGTPSIVQQLDQWPCKNAPGTNQDVNPRYHSPVRKGDTTVRSEKSKEFDRTDGGYSSPPPPVSAQQNQDVFVCISLRHHMSRGKPIRTSSRANRP